MGELDLLKQFRAHAPTHPSVIVGPGQDCAILCWPAGRDLAFKIDQIVEGTHFLRSGPEAASAKQIGWKAMAKACSDIAATGYWPVAATVAVNLAKGTPPKVALELYDGICACCKRFGFALAGGDLSVSKNKLSVVVSLLGDGPKGKAWLRRGAKSGDLLMVTGTLGGSRGGKHLDFEPRLKEARELRKLIPNGVHACIDITDGLSRDLHHICEESRCGAEVFETEIPYSRDARKAEKSGPRSALDHVLRDGEDFELLMAVDPRAAATLLKRWKLKTKLSVIGRITPAKFGCKLVRRDGTHGEMADIGYEHRA